MSKIIKCLIVLMIMMSSQIMAQNEKSSPTIEVSFSIFQTNPILFQKNYDSNFQNDVFTNNTFGYNIGVRRTQSILFKNLSWFVGTRMGTHAYSVDLYLTPEFRDLGSNLDYTTFDKNHYEMFLVDIFSGLRYDFSISKKMKIGIEASAVANYHFQNEIKHNEISVSNSGQSTTLMSADMNVNTDNKIMIAAQLGASYQYFFQNGGFRFSAYTLTASNNILTGSYQIFGDNEILNGTLAKNYNFGGLEIGYFWNL